MPEFPAVIRAVVFDFDGLMLNTEDVFELVGQQLLARRSLVMTDAIRRGMLGRRPVDAFGALKAATGIEDPIPALMRETEQLFDAAASGMLRPMPGLLDLLGLLDRLAVPRAVATSSPRDYLFKHLDQFRLRGHFPLTLTSDDVTHGKPHPEIYLRAAAALHVAPQDMLVLEDSETGTRAAAAAGAFVVSVPNAHTASGDFESSSLLLSSLADPFLSRIIAERFVARDAASESVGAVRGAHGATVEESGHRRV